MATVVAKYPAIDLWQWISGMKWGSDADVIIISHDVEGINGTLTKVFMPALAGLYKPDYSWSNYPKHIGTPWWVGQQQIGLTIFDADGGTNSFKGYKVVPVDRNMPLFEDDFPLRASLDEVTLEKNASRLPTYTEWDSVYMWAADPPKSVTLPPANPGDPPTVLYNNKGGSSVFVNVKKLIDDHKAEMAKELKLQLNTRLRDWLDPTKGTESNDTDDYHVFVDSTVSLVNIEPAGPGSPDRLFTVRLRAFRANGPQPLDPDKQSSFGLDLNTWGYEYNGDMSFDIRYQFDKLIVNRFNFDYVDLRDNLKVYGTGVIGVLG